jgi:hypothetical protein
MLSPVCGSEHEITSVTQGQVRDVVVLPGDGAIELLDCMRGTSMNVLTCLLSYMSTLLHNLHM